MRILFHLLEWFNPTWTMVRKIKKKLFFFYSDFFKAWMLDVSLEEEINIKIIFLFNQELHDDLKLELGKFGFFLLMRNFYL